MAALLLDQWCLHTFQCLSKILSPNRRRRKGASSIGRCLHPPIPTTSGKIWKCIFLLIGIHTPLSVHTRTPCWWICLYLRWYKNLWLSYFMVLCKSSFFCNTHCIDWVNLNVWRQILVDSGTTSSCPDSTQYTGWSSSFFIALKFVCWHGRLWLSASTAIGSKYKHIWHQQRLRCKNWCYIYGVKNICAN